MYDDMSVLDQFGRSYLSAEVFVRRAFQEIETLDQRESRLRKGSAKKLIEEVLPLARFFRHFDLPWRKVRCRFFGASHKYDAKITVCGPEVERKLLKPLYFVEVTTAVSPNEYLRREATGRYGGVFISGEIRRVGSRGHGDRISRHRSPKTAEHLFAEWWIWR